MATPSSNLVTRERRLLAKCDGLLSRWAGRPASSNPFPIGTIMAAEWGRGWGWPDDTLGRPRIAS